MILGEKIIRSEKDDAVMILIPAGEFLYGFDLKKIHLESFYIDMYPVTNEQYKKFVDATGYHLPHHDEDWGKPYNWLGRKYPEGKGRHPVVLVDWHDAVAYAEWAGKRLPTEQEWEKAARGTDGRSYPWGDEFSRENCNSKESGIGGTTPVDKYEAGRSPYGCCDMAGNVWEWTSSWHPKVENARVFRGGSWIRNALAVQCAYRSGGVPTTKINNLGFRCCMPYP